VAWVWACLWYTTAQSAHTFALLRNRQVFKRMRLCHGIAQVPGARPSGWVALNLALGVAGYLTSRLYDRRFLCAG